MSGFNQVAVLSKCHRKPTDAAEEQRKHAWLGADVHDDKDRRRAGSRQGFDHTLERLKTSSRSRNHHDGVHANFNVPGTVAFWPLGAD
jgi:hypothetical protein